MDYDAVPNVLKTRPQWVTWLSTPDPKKPNGKPRKVPYNPMTGTKAQSTNPETWSSFEVAVKAARARNHTGIGFVFSPDDPYVGIDLDNCIDGDATIDDWAQTIVTDMDSYSEISPSGNGIKLIVMGQLPQEVASVKTAQIEIYTQGRYFTITGQHLPGTPTTIRDVNGALTTLCERVRPPERPTEPTPAAASTMRPATGNAETAEFYAQWASRIVDQAASMLALEPDGNLHNKRIDMGRWVGGLIPLGLATADELERRLYHARIPSSHHVAERTAIQDGIQMGSLKPLELPAPPPQPLFDRAGYACCPTHSSRLNPSKNGNGYKCHRKDRTTASGWCDFWWKGNAYIPPHTPAAEPSAGERDTHEPVAHELAGDRDILPILLRATELSRIPPAIALIRDVLFVNTLHQFFGAPGSAKSFLLLDIACTVAQRYPVVYVAAEAIEDYEARVNAWSAHHGQSVENLFFWREPLHLDNPLGVQQFTAALSAIGPALIVFDPLADCMAGLDENSTSDMGLAIEALNTIRRTTHAAIAIVHHTGWNDEHERGSSKLRGACRIVVKIEMRDDGQIRFSCIKKNQGLKFTARHFRLIAAGDMGGVLPLPAHLVLTGRAKLTDRMLKVMEALTTEPLRKGATHTQLMQDTQLTAGTLNRLLTLLSESDFVTSMEKGRATYYELTSAGQDALEIAASEAGSGLEDKVEDSGRYHSNYNWFVLSSTDTGLQEAVLPNASTLSSNSAQTPPPKNPLGGFGGKLGDGFLPPAENRVPVGYDTPMPDDTALFPEQKQTVLTPAAFTGGVDWEHLRKMYAQQNVAAIRLHCSMRRSDSDAILEQLFAEAQPESEAADEAE